MSKDHFKVHSYIKNRVDWNFNIIIDDMPEIETLAKLYSQTIRYRSALYAPVPLKWLHMTILRVGFTDDFTPHEIGKIAELAKPGLAAVRIPMIAVRPAVEYLGYPILMFEP